jgi:hypothetical protein
MYCVFLCVEEDEEEEEEAKGSTSPFLPFSQCKNDTVRDW